MTGSSSIGSLVVELVPHMDAGDRTLWKGDQDERPLSDLGRRQAETLAGMLAAAPVDALYSSPALRCRQTLAPLAARFGLPITVLPELRETDGFAPPAAWADLTGPVAQLTAGAHAAGRACAALRRIRSEHPSGRVVACSHGDLIPAAIAFLAAARAIPLPPQLRRRGDWYTLRFEDDGLEVAAHRTD